MAELNELMKQCLIDADNEHPEMNWDDTIVEAFRGYSILTGDILEFDSEEEGMEFLQKARYFLLDCVLWNMVEKGLIEIDAMDEDGDLFYKLVK